MLGHLDYKSTFCRILIAFLAAAGWIAPLNPQIAAHADTLSVCQSGCTFELLQNAVDNVSSGDTLIVAADTYSRGLDIKQSVTLIGAGTSSTIIDGAPAGAAVTVEPGATVTIVGMTIRNGRNNGAVGINNGSGGCAMGGGIVNQGTLTLTDSAVTGNVVIGGTGGVANGPGGAAYGGGIYNTGTLTATYVSLANNLVSGGAGGFDPKLGGRGGSSLGGAIYNDGKMTLSHVTVSSGAVVGGAGGSAGVGDYPAGSGGSGGAARGAGVYNSVELSITESSIEDNVGHGGAGANGVGGIGGVGGPADGAGIYNTGLLTVTASTLSSNSITGGLGGSSNTGLEMGGNGGVSHGAGIYNDNAASVANGTVSGNTAVGGDGGAGYYFSGIGKAGNAYGGRIYNTGSFMVASSTISKNNAIGGIVGDFGAVPDFGKGFGGGIFVEMPNITLQNTILGLNSADLGPDCAGSILSSGFNLLADTSNCSGINNVDDQSNVNPRLASLQDNGGPTWTLALLPNSPAINAGNAHGCKDAAGILLINDQRGLPRADPKSGLCDIGAFEFQPGTIGGATPTPRDMVTSTTAPVPTYTPVTPPSNTPMTAPSNTPATAPSNTPVTPPTSSPVLPPSRTPIVSSTDTPTSTPTVRLGDQISAIGVVSKDSSVSYGEDDLRILTTVPIRSLTVHIIVWNPFGPVEDSSSTVLTNVRSYDTFGNLTRNIATTENHDNKFYDVSFGLPPGQIIPPSSERIIAAQFNFLHGTGLKHLYGNDFYSVNGVTGDGVPFMLKGKF